MPRRRTRFARHRKAAGFSQERLAEALGVDRSTIVRWEAATTEPQPWARSRLASIFEITVEELSGLLDDVDEAVDLERRLPSALSRPSSADLVTVAELRERLLEVDASYDTNPSTDLIGPAGQVHGQIVFLRTHARNARVRRALYEVEAESSTLMGQLIWDASQRQDSNAPLSYFDQAISAARHSADPYAEGYAVLRKAYVALYGRQPEPSRGLALAQQAAAATRARSPALTGLALLHVAESHAVLGELRSCEHALADAERQLGLVNEDDMAAEHYSLDEFERLVGSCYLFLGLPARAEPTLEACAMRLARKQKSQAIALANWSLSLIRQRKVDDALDSLHRAIDVVEQTRGGGALNLVFAAGRELGPWRRQAGVQDAHDRLLALMASP